MEEIHAIKGTPGKPVPGSNDQRIPVRIRVPEKPIQQPSEQASVPRGVRTERGDFDKHGYTEGCEGCNRMKHGGDRRPHTKKCRERMLKAMGEDEEGREKIKRREEDINEQIARDVERRMREDEAKAEADKGGGKGGRIPTMVGNPHQQTRGVRQRRRMMIMAKVAQEGIRHRRSREKQRVGNRRLIKPAKGISVKHMERTRETEGGRRRN